MHEVKSKKLKVKNRKHVYDLQNKDLEVQGFDARDDDNSIEVGKQIIFFIISIISL